MNKKSKIFIAGHNGMVGSAIWRNLESKGYTNIIGKSSKELDLRNQKSVIDYFEKEKPEFVFLAAAKVGGILANDTYRAQFIYDNLQIQNNVIHQSYVNGVKKLLFLGSSCIYPRDCPQPMKEEYLLTGELEQTNEPYAIAKIAGIKMCESYYRQYGANFISAMPTNLYGPNDNYDLETSHVLPALLRKIHLGKALENNNWDTIRANLNRNPIKGINGSSSLDEILIILNNNGISITSEDSTSGIRPLVSISLWGSGNPKREFLHVDDMAEACIYLINNYNKNQFVNIGCGQEISIKDLATRIKEIVGFHGELKFDTTKPDGTMKKLTNISLLNALGWKYTTHINEGLINTYKWYLKNNN
ncbi:MAG: GDP-L-fucose synthase [Candidatus Marinimicrobia bacterium]|nr:GDP-L-fucose synthase [Candidatus Neomarinimicrobiota bacterium]